MSIDWVRARIRCDECGDTLCVDIDAAYEGEVFGLVMAAIEDTPTTEGARLPNGHMGFGSLDGERMLCAKCSGDLADKEAAAQAKEQG